VKELAEGTGQDITASLTSVRKRLRDTGKLVSTGKDEGRDTIPIRKMIEGIRHLVLHLRADDLEVSATVPTEPWAEPDQQT
jgi:hypothetical protein